jgi:hypothetical protein
MTLNARAQCCQGAARLLAERQAGMLTVLKEGVPGFAAIRHLTIRFQSLLRHHNETKLDRWLDDAKDCGIPASGMANTIRETATTMITSTAITQCNSMRPPP